MSDEELRKQLQILEEDYVGQPVVVQQTDLREINRIRAELGMSLVNAQLKDVTADEAAASAAGATAQLKYKTKQVDHSAARAIYTAYLQKIEDLRVHQDYADRVCKATSGAGQTPVRPLATMGTGGGALLCDYCGKAIVLEGGNFNGVTADVAWQQRKGAPDNWTSYILGGLVVDVKSNGTLRIYHGYPGTNDKQCCNAAIRDEKKAQADAVKKECPVKSDAMLAFLAEELPDVKTREDRLEVLYKIWDTLYPTFDPGLGRNRP